ncbi:hypothetical protein DL96DRAFT_1589179 [Flagelloscypha sp. PMI_526]|nr:hypothetical protein DL96DRAFT_1589179 [Flagelloscypha sp. PMI_526]
MLAFEVYCMLSGIASTGPPSILPRTDEELVAIANGLVERLVDTGRTNLPPADELTTILKDLLDDDSLGCQGLRWCNATVAVFGPTRCAEENSRYLRFCQDKGRLAYFEKTLDPSGKWIDRRISIMEEEDGDQDCAFMFRRCWSYLQCWLDVFPPGVKDGTPFAKALWDIVGPSLGQGWPTDSLLPELDYGQMLFTWARDGQYFWDGWDNDQDAETEDRVAQVLENHCLAGVPNLAEAISQGHRGETLLPAFHRDMGIWIFEDPDIPTFRVFQTSNTFDSTKPNLLTLPLDLLYEILPHLPLIDVLNTSAICKSMRNLLLCEDVFTTLLRKMIYHDLLSWIEVEDAH